MARVQRYSDIGNGRILGLTGAVGGNRAPSRTLAGFHGLDGLGQRADLIDLYQQGVRGIFLDRFTDAFGIGHQQVITNNLDFIPQFLCHKLPGSPVILGMAIFDRDDGIVIDPLRPELDHLLAGQLPAFLAQVIGFGIFFVQLRGCRVEGDGHIQPAAGFESRLFDGRENNFYGFVVGLQGGGVTAFIADQGGVTLFLQHGFQGVVDLCPPADAFGKARRAERHDHKLLHVGGLPGGMRAAVQNVHHRHRQDVGVDTAQIAIEGQAERVRRRFRHSQADAQDGIRSQLGLVRRPVQGEQLGVDRLLLHRVPAKEGVRDRAVDVGDGLGDTFAEIALLVAIPQLERFVHACGRPGGYCRASPRAVSKVDFHLNSRIAARIQDFKCRDTFDDCFHFILRMFDQ